MTELNITPISFNVTGNLIPSVLALLADTTPFTPSNATLAIITESGVKKLQVTANW